MTIMPNVEKWYKLTAFRNPHMFEQLEKAGLDHEFASWVADEA